MKILTQNKQHISDITNKSIWTVRVGEVCYIMHNGYICAELGVYDDESTANKVLIDISKAIGAKEELFIMP